MTVGDAVSGDVVARAKAALAAVLAADEADDGVPYSGVAWEGLQLAAVVPELVAEVECLRWQVRHGDTDHMCDECWPDEGAGA